MSAVSPVDQDDFSRGGRPKRVGLLFMSAHLRAGAVSRTEDASGAIVGGFHAPGAPENASRTPGGVHSLWSRLFCGPLKMRRVPEEAVFGTECLRKRLPCRKRRFSCTEYLFRTVEACFLHRMLPKMRRVPQEAFLSTARIFRTIGGPLRYRMPTQRQVAAAAEPGVHFSRPPFVLQASLQCR